MRRNGFTGIVMTSILLTGLMAACANKDQPRAASPGKVGTGDASKGKVGVREVTTGPNGATPITDIARGGKKQKGELPKVVLIITTQACHCTLERCAKGEKIVNKVVQQSPQELTFEKLDQAREETSADSLVRRYGVHYLPALLFFDGKGNFQGKLEGFWDEGTVIDKLVGMGVG